MTTNDLQTAIVLFVGLLAADVYLLQLAHSRHHELSIECFRMRETIMRLRDRMRSLCLPGILPPGTQALLRDLVTEERAWLTAYASVNSRYYLATRGIKWVPVSLVLSVVVILISVVTHSPPLWVILVALGSATLPLLVGTTYITVGDLWKAEEAQRVMDNWFGSTSSPADRFRPPISDEVKA